VLFEDVDQLEVEGEGPGRGDPFGQILAERVDEWRAADDRTLEIRLKRPFALLLDALAKPDANVPFIMPERLARTDANTQVSEMVGSGPYRFMRAEFVSGSRVVYEKFDGYRPRNEPADGAAGGKIAHYQRIEWHILPDPATAAAALQAGEVDWLDQPLPDLIPTLTRNRNIQVDVLNPYGIMSVMRLNHLQAPFNDRATALVARSRHEGFAAGVAAALGAALGPSLGAADSGPTLRGADVTLEAALGSSANLAATSVNLAATSAAASASDTAALATASAIPTVAPNVNARQTSNWL
jgi:hypothetical protein